MSRLETASGQGPPPFEPPVEILSSLTDSIQAALAQYAAASTPQEKASALKAIQSTSSKLSTATSPIQQRFMELNNRPYLNVAVRIAFELSLFEAIPQFGRIAIKELADKINASEEFIFRLMRVLGAFEILEVTYPPPNHLMSFAHTPMSRLLISPAAKASFRNHFEILLPAHLSSVPGYFHKYGFKSPEDFKNVPFTFAHGTQDEDFFDLLVKDENKLKIFNDAMAIMAVLGLKPLGSLFAFDKLVPNEDGVALVDIGGGKGQMLKAIQEAYPKMKGKLVLEDLKVVLDGGVVVSEDVKLQTYDFFKEVQPIKGSNYFLKSIFHDWPDKACLQILSNLAPAMRGHPHSKLLICELVLPDRYPEPAKVVRDINMLLIGGQERNLFQWQGLLQGAGFKIANVHGSGGDNSSIIEAVLNE
ncbi:O-methyltransferase-domain-containing protein [Hyaloscypha finlandica]|nr:O-methyltransferase-domain-containing protein [Hyaloscypha finlandica]